MTHWFNTAGPCQADIHYMLPPISRLPTVERLIQQRSYFVIHAPRQTGKTTAMLALAQSLTERGDFTAVLVSAEVGAAFRDDVERAEQAILAAWHSSMTVWLPPELHPPQWIPAEPGQRIQANLRHWADHSKRPLVLFIDEIDALQGAPLISILRQLRDGYSTRPKAFPHSVGLIGLRDVRDYKAAAGGSDRLNTASPFNVKVQSLTLRDFTAQEVADLYSQHTAETGQAFTDEAVATAFELTQGQPWLVNALAKAVVEDLVPDLSVPIGVDPIYAAKELLIRRQDTHLDSLAERLQESRVRAIVEPILAGQELGNVPHDDRQYLVDLGLLKRDPAGGLVVANPIYREVIPRVLAQAPQDSLPVIRPSWLTLDGALDVDALLAAFLSFWRQHGEPLLNSSPYHEIAPHLVLMAFLHRVVNGGGTLEREYAIGSDRMDLCLRYGAVILGIELKVWRDNRADPKTAGLKQLDGYLARLGLETGWLVIFDRRQMAPPLQDRLKAESASTPQGRAVTVVRA